MSRDAEVNKVLTGSRHTHFIANTPGLWCVRMRLYFTALCFILVIVGVAIKGDFWQELRGLDRDHMLERITLGKTLNCFMVFAYPLLF